MYAIIKGRGKDGIGLVVLSERALHQRALKNPNTYGFSRFEDETYLVMNPEPEDWPEGTAVLIKLDVLMPKLVAGEWVLEQ